VYDLNLIKSRISCVAYAQRIGLPITKSGDRCISPIRSGAKNPSSFVVYDDFYYDFAAGTGGDVIELCAVTQHHGDRGSAIRDLATITGVPSDNTESTQAWLDYTHQLNSQTAYYNTQLTDSDRDYLHSRGLSDDDISRLKIGRVTDGALRGRLFLPYFSGADGYVCYYATRSLPGGAFPDNKYMKQKRDEHSQHLPWGLQTLNRDSDTLVIAEGYFDAVSFEISGYPVLSAITGRFSRDQIPVVLSVARKFKRVFIVYDNDAVSHAGESFTHAMSEILTRHRIPFVVGTVPPPYHDISEYFAAGGNLSDIITAAEPGISYIASRITDFSELEKFVYTVARHTKRTALDELHATLRASRRWDSDSLKSLFKSATTAPPENIVTDEILVKHQLVYIPDVGFYEYDHGVWSRMGDNTIKSYADQAYGEFSTAQRVNAVCNLAKVRALQPEIQFDKQPVWNFINGTLDLESGTFRDHNPNDYCSMQSSYPYNPDATYDAWSRFIDDVTMSDPRASELLQLFPGYVLFPTNEHEKIFMFSGSGGNGKTRYLEILRQLFGGSNVSHVTPRGLCDKFQRILLRDSILNIAGEIRSDLRDSEEYLKSIASGEPQSACYKGQDFITFTSRTKLAFATNSQLSSGDTSDGLARRLIMVDFKVSFVDDPDPNDPYQKRKNIHILDELTSELQSGGIFNWVYEGYKLLRTVGYFTETHDQQELLSEFKRSSNPILVFWEDTSHDYDDQFSNTEIYRDYQQWCLDNGERPVTSSVFHREFKKVSGRDYEAYRTKQERGYRKIGRG
jgi:P4 family phage/plasmid primase-like protien